MDGRDVDAAMRRLRDTPLPPRIAGDLDAVFAELACLRAILRQVAEAIETGPPGEARHVLTTLAGEIRERISGEGA